MSMSESTDIAILPAFLDNYIYVVAWGQEAAVVDPADPDVVLHTLKERQLRLSCILNTHHHLDHVAGNEQVKAATGCRVIGPDDPRIPGLDEAVKDGDSLALGPLQVDVLATPGHGSHDISFYATLSGSDQPGMLWCGDTLFCGGCGRLFEGSPAQMWDSLTRLAALPDDTRIYCGHEYTVENLEFAAQLDPSNPDVQVRLAEAKQLRHRNQPTVPSTMGLEKATNPFLRAEHEDIQKALGMSDAEAVKVFAELRRRKDRF